MLWVTAGSQVLHEGWLVLWVTAGRQVLHEGWLTWLVLWVTAGSQVQANAPRNAACLLWEPLSWHCPALPLVDTNIEGKLICRLLSTG